jgi:hypothetical protein
MDPKSLHSVVEADATFRVFAPVKGQKYGTIYVTTRWLEAVVGLSPEEEHTSGIAFWRHAPTGLESAYCGPELFDIMLRIDAMFKTRLLEGARAVQALAPKISYVNWVNSLYGASAARMPFPSGNHGPWELLGSVPLRYNRLIAFPTWRLRGIHMKKEPGTTRETARLTLNVSIGHPVLELRERLPVAPLPGLDA